MSNQRSSNITTWFAENSVAANLLMLALLLAGVLGFSDIRREVLPNFQLDGIRISMAYPGASPEEVEKGIILAIEKELGTISGITKVIASAKEGSASITAELDKGSDPDKLLQDVRTAIDRITSFPDNAEPAKTSLRAHGFYVISISIAADIARYDLFNLSQNLRTQLLNINGVSRVEERGGLEPQINFDIPRDQLQALSISLNDVAKQVDEATKDIPAGSLKTDKGEILLRTQGSKSEALAYADIPIKTLPDGTQITLQDIATIEEGFEQSARVYEFNGKPGVRLDVYQADNQRPIEIAKKVRQLIEQVNAKLPDTVSISIARDRSERYAERRDIMIKNGAMGLALVVLALGIFLNIRLAFWVAVSIPVVFIATFAVMPVVDVTLNMISMFAFILTLGIVVDDAIIIGENIYSKIQKGLPTKLAISEGTNEMIVPVLYAVGTNILAFIPLMMVPGTTGQFIRSLPYVAAIVFAISLIEALFILPSHLKRLELKQENKVDRGYSAIRRIKRFHQGLATSLDRLRDGVFKRLIHKILKERYITVLLFVGFTALTAIWYESGRIDLSWRTEIPGNSVDAELEMPAGTSLKETLATIRIIEAAGLRAIDRLGGRQYLKSWFTRAGARNRETYGDVNLLLVSDSERPFSQETLTRVWREEIGDLPQAKAIFFEYLVGPSGNRGLNINLSHSNIQTLETAAKQLAATLEQRQGVVDISNGIAEGKRQINFELTPLGRAQGLDENNLGRQLRDAFFGAEVHRILRDGKEVKVMVRLPAEQRNNILDLHDFIITTPSGGEIALIDAATLAYGSAYGTINREEGKRILKVVASIDKKSASTRRVREELTQNVLPQLETNFPGLRAEFSGHRRSRINALNAIFEGLTWVVLITFALTAALFRSYSQGLIVMLAIPFSVAAAVAGHVIMGFDLSSSSVFGIIALCGLVVNGALVLTVKLNQFGNGNVLNAIEQAACARFRPIVLTALTTTLGLLPMLFETSTQALFLVPMAIALSFGTIASAIIVLLLIPCLHAIANDIKTLFKSY